MRILILFVVCLFGSPAEATVFYDVNLDGQLDGERPVLGGGPFPRIGPTSALFGSRVSTTADPADPELHLVHDGQVGFELGRGASRYEVAFDLRVGRLDSENGALGDRLTLLLDTPQVRTLNFDPLGGISTFQLGRTDISSIGWVEGVPLAVVSQTDLVASTWQVFLDGTLAIDTQFAPSADITAVRLGVSDFRNDFFSPQVWIDDIRISDVFSSVPEARAPALLAVALLIGLWFRSSLAS